MHNFAFIYVAFHLPWPNQTIFVCKSPCKLLLSSSDCTFPNNFASSANFRNQFIIPQSMSLINISRVRFAGRVRGLNPPKNFWTLPVNVDLSSWGSILTHPVHTVIYCHLLLNTARVILSWSKWQYACSVSQYDLVGVTSVISSFVAE